MEKEFKVERVNLTGLEITINEYFKEGYELFSMAENNGLYVLVFRKIRKEGKKK